MSTLLLASLLLFSPPVRACAPPANMCDRLADECADVGLKPNRCEVLVEGVCPGSRCMACEASLRDCTTAGFDCTDLAEFCDVSLEGCSCTPRCTPAAELTLTQLFAVCFAHPWMIGDDCKKPSAGQCFAILTLGRDLCNVTACEYIECMEDMEDLGQCGVAPPSCKRLVACDVAENG